MSDSNRNGKIESVGEVLERIRLDRNDITGVFARYISKYSNPNSKKDVFDEMVEFTLSDGPKRKMSFLRYLELLRREEIDLVSNGNPRRIYLGSDITRLIKGKVPKKILQRLNGYSNGHLTRRCDKGHVLFKGARYGSSKGLN